MSDKYEITILSPEGILKKMITKTSISRKISQADIDKVAFKSTVYNKTKYVIDENMPYIADFFILDNNYILVITFENDYEDATIAGDIFDNNGNYRGRIDVPKYYWWYSLWNGWKNKAQYKNGYFYTIETDDAEENFCIKRYKMILE